MLRLWKKGEAQLERITTNMLGMCGELQGVSQQALPQLEDIGLLFLLKRLPAGRRPPDWLTGHKSRVILPTRLKMRKLRISFQVRVLPMRRVGTSGFTRHEGYP